MINTTYPGEFEKWINSKLEVRDKEYVEKQDLNIDIDKDLKEAF